MLLIGWALIAAAMAGLWARQRRTRNATSVDVAWAFSLAALATFYALVTDGDPLRRWLVGGLAVAWAVRLGGFLLVTRVLGSTDEDGRYRSLRRRWGEQAQRNFFWFYQAQAAVAILFSLPVLGAMRGGPPGGWAIAGGVVWLVAVLGETIADRQLDRFRANPANEGEVCRAGLWRYSRHPNYFFEWLHWPTCSSGKARG